MDSSFSFIGVVIQENRRDVIRVDRRKSKRIFGGTSGVWVQFLGHCLDDLTIYLSIVGVKDAHLLTSLSLKGVYPFLVQLILLLFPRAEDGLL